VLLLGQANSPGCVDCMTEVGQRRRKVAMSMTARSESAAESSRWAGAQAGETRVLLNAKMSR
jgi:hypothetical protein